MPQNSIELLQKLMEKYSRVFMSFAENRAFHMTMWKIS